MFETAKQIGDRVNLSAKTIGNLRRAGKIPCVKLNGKVIRYSWPDVEAALRGAANVDDLLNELQPATA
jgi:hypothetical protein